MAKWIIGHGIDNYISDLEKLLVDTEEIIKRSAYVGAGIVTDAIRSEIEALPVREFDKDSGMVNGLTRSQKEGLLQRDEKNGLGITHFRKDGDFIHVKVGVAGYNSTKTDKYPKGQPNAMIIRALEAGTSFRSRNPVVTRGVNSSRRAAEQAMKEQCDEEIKKRIH